MIYELSLKERLDCVYSFATEDSAELLCEFDGKCDGTLYDCCLWDNEELERKVFYALEEHTE